MAPNILLVIADSLRARNCSLYGYPHDTTPFLSSLSDESTVYHQARAPSTWSYPSHVSIFTGLHVAEHGCTNYQQEKLSDGTTIWETLRDEYDYETGVFSSNPYLTKLDTGLQTGFDTVVDKPVNAVFPEAFTPAELERFDSDNKYLAYLRSALASDAPLKSVVNGLDSVLPVSVTDTADDGTYFLNAFEEWVADAEGPWTGCINFMDTHTPFRPVPEFDNWGSNVLHRLQEEKPTNHSYKSGDRSVWEYRAFEALYDGTVRQVDSYLASIVEELKRQDEFNDTLLVVTSDHGEGFAEQDELFGSERVIGHASNSLNEELTHIPLLAKFPKQSTSASISAPASLTKFPHVVQQVIRGEDATDDFVPSGPVISQCTGTAEWKLKKARAFSDSVSEFKRQGRAVYRETDWGVSKSVTVANRSGSFVIDDEFGRIRRDADASAAVSDAFADIESQPVQRSETDESLSTESKERLEELGYLG